MIEVRIEEKTSPFRKQADPPKICMETRAFPRL